MPAIKIGPLEFEPPRWCAALLAAVGLVLITAAASFYVWSEYAAPAFHVGEAYVTETRLTQLEESQRHFFETPQSEWTLDDGDGLARYYASDRCTAVRWRSELGEVVRFVLHPSRTFDRVAQVYVAGTLLAQEANRCAEAPCGEPEVCRRAWPDGGHPGEFESWTEPLDDCTVIVRRRWADCCETAQRVDTCERAWHEVEWTCCRHGRRK